LSDTPFLIFLIQEEQKPELSSKNANVDNPSVNGPKTT